MLAVRKIISINKMAYWLFLVYWVMKPYYLFESGGLQIADFFVLFSFIAILFDSKKLAIRKQDLLLIGFVVAVAIINGIYAVIYKENMFIKSTLYYVFNLIAIILFVRFSEEESFLHDIKNLSAFNIVMQLAIWITGYGRMYGSSTRYRGTFNDPNQFAFFILMMLFVIYLIEKTEKTDSFYIRKRYKPLFLWTYLVSGILSLMSASAGMVMGFAIFTWLFLFYEIENKNKLLWLLFIFTLIILIIICFLIGSRYGIQLLDALSKNNVYLNRIVTKLFSFMTEDNGTLFITDRKIDTVLEYPLYCLIGAGEGSWNRFVIDGSTASGEIHSTPIALLFCYGILPFSVLVAWIKKNISGCPKYAYSVLIALLIESFTLVNHRQSIFWIIIVLAGMCRSNEARENI